LPQQGLANTYGEGIVTRIEREGQVFINNNPGKTSNIPAKTKGTPKYDRITRGGILLTRNSTAVVNFFPKTRGKLFNNTEVRMGKTCLELQPSGWFMLSGKACAKIGAKQTNPNSTYEVVRDDAGIYTLRVGAGEVTVDEQTPGTLAESANDPSSASLLSPTGYPTINPYFGTGISGDTYAYPSSGGLVMGQINAFVPLSQSESSKLLYSYTAASSNFDGYTGIGTEIGYRWFTPSNQSSTGLYLGVSGFDTPSCFNTLMNLGAGYEVSRWRFGASTGLKVGGCDSGFSYAGLNVSLPIADMGQQRSLHLSLSPYMIWGSNIVSPGSIYESGGAASVSPGGKVALNIPLSESFSIKAYSSIDTVYGVSLGGSVVYRIPTRKGFIDDPNLKHSSPEAAQPSAQPSTSTLLEDSRPGMEHPHRADSFHTTVELVAQANPDVHLSTASDAALGTLRAQGASGGNPVTIREGQQARFTADGDLIDSIVDMKPIEIRDMMLRWLKGSPLMPESRRLAKVAARYGVLTRELARVAGLYFVESAVLPVSETVDTPFGMDRFPTGTYSCQATPEGKIYAEDKLRSNGYTAAANQIRDTGVVYLGKGDKVSDGWPATAFEARAYVFSNGAACEKLNSIINNSSGYTGPTNPLRLVAF
jgi:hypothetical protein